MSCDLHCNIFDLKSSTIIVPCNPCREKPPKSLITIIHLGSHNPRKLPCPLSRKTWRRKIYINTSSTSCNESQKLRSRTFNSLSTSSGPWKPVLASYRSGAPMTPNTSNPSPPHSSHSTVDRKGCSSDRLNPASPRLQKRWDARLAPHSRMLVCVVLHVWLL